MTVKKGWESILVAGRARFSNSLALVLWQARRGGSFRTDPQAPPPPPPPPPQDVPFHFCDEVSPYLLPIQKEMQQNPATRVLAPNEFRKLLQLRVELKVWETMKEREILAPNSFHTWLMDGKCRVEYKKGTVEKRLATVFEKESASEAKMTKKQNEKIRKQRRNQERNVRRKIERSERFGGEGKNSNEGEGKGGESNRGTKEGSGGGAGQNMEEREGEVVADESGKGKGKEKKVEISTANAKASISEADLAFPIDPATFLFHSNLVDGTRRSSPDPSRVRLIVPRQEAESLLDLAATLNTTAEEHRTARGKNYQQLESVHYGEGAEADPTKFLHPRMQTISCLVDSDQFATANFDNFGWALSSVRMGRQNYEAHQIPSTPDSPQHLDLPMNPKQPVPCYRLVEYSSLIGAVFRSKTQEGIAGTIVLNGNDYSPGGAQITLAKLNHEDHRPLIEFISDMGPYRKAVAAENEEDLRKLESKFKSLLAGLPPSKFIKDLTLAEFYKLQQVTQGFFDENGFDKDSLSRTRKDLIKSEVASRRSAEKSLLVQQIAQVNESRPNPRNQLQPHNFRHLPRSVWPKTSARQAGGGGEVERDIPKEVGGGGAASPGEREGVMSEGEEGEVSVREGGASEDGGREGGSGHAEGGAVRMEEEGGGVDIEVDVEGGSARGGENEEDVNRKGGGIRAAPSSYEGKQLPFQRKDLPDLHEQIQQAKNRVTLAEDLPTEKPDPPLSSEKPKDFEDAKPRFITVERRLDEAIRKLRLKDVAEEDRLPVQFATAMYELHQGITIAGAKELEAAHRAFFSAHDLLLSQEWKEQARDAVSMDQTRTGEVYSAPDVQARLHLSLSSAATATMNYYNAKTGDGRQPTTELVTSLLSSPDAVLERIESLLPTVSSRFTLASIQVTVPRPSEAVSRLWKRLAADKTKSKTLVDEVVRFVLSTSIPSLDDPKLEEPDLDAQGQLNLPLLPLHLESLIRQLFESICAKPQSVDDEILKVKQNVIDQAVQSLMSIVRYLSFLLPRLLFHFIAQALRNENFLDPPRRSGRSGEAPPAPVMSEVMEKFKVSTERPIKEYLTSYHREKVLQVSVRAFQLSALTAAGTLKHKFEPKCFDFGHGTAYFYSAGAREKTVGDSRILPPPLLIALQNLYKNEVEIMKRIDAVRHSGGKRQDLADVGPEGGELLRENPAVEEGMEIEEGEGVNDVPHDSKKEEEGTKPNYRHDYAATFMNGLDRKTRKSKDLKKLKNGKKTTRGERNADFPHLRSLSTDSQAAQSPAQDPSLPDNPAVATPASDTHEQEPFIDSTTDSSRRFRGRQINGMHRLLPAERVASIRLSYPNLQFSEALASSSFFDLAKDQPNEGWVKFVLNEKRVLKVCDSVRLVFEAVISGSSKSDRLETLVRLRHEILNLLFKVEGSGTLIPWMYAVTPWSLNIVYRDPRYPEKLPGGNFKTFVESTLGTQVTTYYYFLRSDRVEEMVKKSGLRRKDQVVSKKWPNLKLSFTFQPQAVPPILTRRVGQFFNWSAAHKKHPSPVPFSKKRAIKPFLVNLKYYDPDSNINELWSLKSMNPDEQAQFKEKLAYGTERFKWEMSDAAAANPDVITWYAANDRGINCPEALAWYSPTTLQALFDLWTRDRHVAETRTRSKTEAHLGDLNGTRERDEFFRDLTADPVLENEQVGARNNIEKHNARDNNNQQIPPSFVRSTTRETFTQQRSRIEKSQMKKDVAIQLNSICPRRLDQKTYRIVIIDGAENLPQSRGRRGPTKDSAYMNALLECISSREDIELVYFRVHEHFTSQTCCFCESPYIFHPEDINTGEEISRISCCADCVKIFHRDEGSARLLLLGAILGARTGVHPFSPNDEHFTIKRPMKQRRDSKYLRPRGTERAKLLRHAAKIWLLKQDRAFELARRGQEIDELAEQGSFEEEMKRPKEELDADLELGDPEDWVLSLPKGKKVEIIDESLVESRSDVPPAMLGSVEAKLAQAGWLIP
ncbi:uncharacterized protein JCM6883_005603 [Sporobolomyces salmoneus]|uniref:uncharacterized protein n=1 Tax=Sporobolomyces salmoneus TaxID=183962 RepID=UPI003171734C